LGNIDGVINEPFETTQQTDFGLSIGLGKTWIKRKQLNFYRN
jgi:hypothetical protein